MSAIVYREVPGKARQYVRRIVSANIILWHADPKLAERMSDVEAGTIAHILHQRSTGWGNTTGAVESSGEYGTENV